MDTKSNYSEKIDINSDSSNLKNQQIVINPDKDPRNLSVQSPNPLTQMRIKDQKPAPAPTDDDIKLPKGIPINTNVQEQKVQTYDTLDEPIKDTLLRDIKRILYK